MLVRCLVASQKTICWRAAPSRKCRLIRYDLVVGNFPSILNDWQNKGCRVAYFVPGHDPELDQYVDQQHEELTLFLSVGFRDITAEEAQRFRLRL